MASKSLLDATIVEQRSASLEAIGTGPHDLHRIRKAAISPFFSPRSISNMEPVLQERASEFCHSLEKMMNEVVDMRVYFFAWTTDFITGQIFRKRAALFWDAKRAEDWFSIMFDFSGKFPLTKHAPWLVTMGLALPLTAWRILFPSLVPYISIYKVSNQGYPRPF